MSIWSHIKRKIIGLVNRLIDGSYQQIVRRCIILAILVAVIVGVTSINIQKKESTNGIITQQEAKKKTDIKIVTPKPEEGVTRTESPKKDDKHVSVETQSKKNNESKDKSIEDNTVINNNSDLKRKKISKKEEVVSVKIALPKVTSCPINTKGPSINKSENLDKTKITCKISIVCDRAIENIEKIENQEVRKYIPKDGKILNNITVSVNKGSTVYDILTAITAEKNIQFDASYSRINKTAYIRGINHLYEKDAGSDSGWVYMVNDIKPSVGCAGYIVENNDVIKWAYSVNGYGEDIE